MKDPRRLLLSLLLANVAVASLLLSPARADRDLAEQRLFVLRLDLRQQRASHLPLPEPNRTTETALARFGELVLQEAELPAFSDKLRSLAAKSGVEALRIEYHPQTVKEDSSRRSLRVSLRLAGSYRNLKRLLYEIEREPLLFPFKGMRVDQEEGRNIMVVEFTTFLRG